MNRRLRLTGDAAADAFKRLDEAALADLIADAVAAEEQAVSGPFYPEKGITRISLLAYAAQCRISAERFQNGGAHKKGAPKW